MLHCENSIILLMVSVHFITQYIPTNLLLFTRLFPGSADNVTQMYCHFTLSLYLPTPFRYIIFIYILYLIYNQVYSGSTAWRKLVNLRRFVLSKDIRLQIVSVVSIQSSPQKLKKSQKDIFQ